MLLHAWVLVYPCARSLNQAFPSGWTTLVMGCATAVAGLFWGIVLLHVDVSCFVWIMDDNGIFQQPSNDHHFVSLKSTEKTISGCQSSIRWYGRCHNKQSLWEYVCKYNVSICINVLECMYEIMYMPSLLLLILMWLFILIININISISYPILKYLRLHVLLVKYQLPSGKLT